MPIAAAVAAIVSHHDLRASQLGMAFYDLDKHRTIYQRDANKYFVAASTTKLITEGTTLALLGPNYRFTTNVYTHGTIDAAGTLHGDVVIRASGDPNLSQRIAPDGTLAFENEDHAYGGSPGTRAVPGDPLAVLRDLARQVAAHGIKQVAGSVVVDDSLFPDDTTEGGTGTGIAPIDVNDNVVDVTIGPGAKAGDPPAVSVSPQTEYVKFVDAATTGAPRSPNTLDMSTDVTDDIGNHTVTIKGSVPAGSRAILYAYPVTNPRQFAEMAFEKALRDAGVDVPAPSAPVVCAYCPLDASDLAPANIIASHVSPPISQDVKITLKVSDNNHAGTMPYLWGALLANVHGPETQSAGFQLENQFLRRAGLRPAEIAVADGEGAFAFIRPAFMVRYLAYVYRQPYYRYLYAGLPIMGVDGTLFDIQTHAAGAGKIHAKTGTNGGTDLLNGERLFLTGKGLAGYMTTRHGRRLAFCIYLNNVALAPNADVTRYAGQVLGEIANAAYVDL